MWKENTQLQPALPFNVEEGKYQTYGPTKKSEKQNNNILKTLVKFTTQRHSLTERLRLNPRTIEGSFPPTPCHIINVLSSTIRFTSVPFSMKNYRHTRWQKAQFEETEQAPEPDLVMAGMMKLFYHKYKSTMANMLRILKEK